MLRGAVARRYAEGIFAIARDHSSFDRWLADLETIRSALVNADMAQLLSDPKVTVAQREAVVSQVLTGKVDQLALNAASLLIRRGHTQAAAGVEREFQRLVNDHRNVAVAEVTTAIELGGSEREAVKQRLEALTTKNIELQTAVDGSILGGFVARVGDVLIDASLKARLAALRQDLLSHT